MKNNQLSSCRTKLLCVCFLVALSGKVLVSTATANEIASDQQILDNNLDLWVDEAPLSLVVDQIAKLSGLELTIDGELAGQVSGRFNGSMKNTLSDIASSHDVLFDLSDGALNAVNKTFQKTASIALTNPTATESIQTLLEGVDAHSGNNLEIKGGTVQLSGHPNFVDRTATEITATLADWLIEPEAKAALPEGVDSATASTNENAEWGDVEQTTDVASVSIAAESSAPLEYMGDGLETDNPPVEVSTGRKEIRWVTDIPGFDTF